MKIKISRKDKSLPLPRSQHGKEDAGLDIFSAENLMLKAGERAPIDTGLKIAIPRGYAGFIYPRSGLALEHGVTVLNADGVIDPGYRGEIKVLLINHGGQEYKITRGDRIAQLIVQKVMDVKWDEVEDLSGTERGKGGFGHTGQ